MVGGYTIDIKTVGTGKGAQFWDGRVLTSKLNSGEWKRPWGGRVLTFKLNSGDWKRSWVGRVLTLIQWGLERGQGLGVGGYWHLN